MPEQLGSLRDRWVFADSSAYLALLDADDSHQQDASVIARELAQQRYRQFTTNVLLVESHALILSTLGRTQALHFLLTMERSATTVVRVRASDEVLAKALLARYDDKDYSFADALSFVVMERLGIRSAFTFDHHFAQYGWFVWTPDRR
jgi:uncharacterized protein